MYPLTHSPHTKGQPPPFDARQTDTHAIFRHPCKLNTYCFYTHLPITDTVRAQPTQIGQQYHPMMLPNVHTEFGWANSALPLSIQHLLQRPCNQTKAVRSTRTPGMHEHTYETMPARSGFALLAQAAAHMRVMRTRGPAGRCLRDLVSMETSVHQGQRAAASHCWHRQPHTRASCVYRVRQEDACVALAGAQQLRLAARQVNYRGALRHLRHAAGHVVQVVTCMLLSVQEHAASFIACALPDSERFGQSVHGKAHSQDRMRDGPVCVPQSPAGRISLSRAPATHAITSAGTGLSP